MKIYQTGNVAITCMVRYRKEMHMKVNHNMSAILANSRLQVTQNNLANSIQKLSSGYKINSAKDNASGLAIAYKMNAQIRALDRASQNALDGVSVVETAEGELNEVHSMLQRMRELSVQAANDTYSLDDRETIQAEIDQLRDEIDRLADSTEFNGQPLLDGTYDTRAYANADGVTVKNVSDSVVAGDYKMMVTALATKHVCTTQMVTGTIQNEGSFMINGVSVDLKVGDTAVQVYEKLRDIGEAAGVNVTDEGGTLKFEAKEYGSSEKVDLGWSESLNAVFGLPNSINETLGTDAKVELVLKKNDDTSLFGSTATCSSSGQRITITDNTGFSMSVIIDQDLYKERTGTDATADSFNTDGQPMQPMVVEVKDYGNMVLQVGGNEGQTTFIRIPEITCENIGIGNINVRSHELASDAISKIDNAISYISSVRSSLGAMQNRLEYTQSSLDVTEESVTAAVSRIMDTDMAEEMTKYTQYTVLQQAGISVLAQANDLPQQVLQLLS